MTDLELDGAAWTSADDFYIAYFAAVGAPEWHGRNLDALWDSLTGGDISERNPPLRFRILGTTRMARDAREVVSRLEKLIKEARHASVPVEIELLP